MTTATHAASATAATVHATAPKAPPMARNGVDTPKLFATIDLVKGQPELAQFQFRAHSHWINGTHCRSTIADYYGAGSEMQHTQPHTADADHPEVLCGADMGPTPVEYLLHALAACLTAGIGNIAAARGIDLASVTAEVEGDIDLQGILGLNDQVRNGFKAIRVSFAIAGDAPADKLHKVIDQAVARSAVYDVLMNGVPVTVDVAAA